LDDYLRPRETTNKNNEISGMKEVHIHIHVDGRSSISEPSCTLDLKRQAVLNVVRDLQARESYASVDSIEYHLNGVVSREQLPELLKLLYREGRITIGPIPSTWRLTGWSTEVLQEERRGV
jgi:hypothetical protein